MINKKKIKSAFFCQNCGCEYTKWHGQCNNCNKWNSIIEELVVKNESNSLVDSKSYAIKVDEIETNDELRLKISDNYLNELFGGGIVCGSLILFCGEPGIGKSTLMLQIALSTNKLKTLYVSGEESTNQIKMRANRLGFTNSDCYILSETNTEKIFNQIKEISPELIIIDSIQTLNTKSIDSSPGSISQIKENAYLLNNLAKQCSISVILIGHVNKEGNIAGPKILEHMVDVVLNFEGDKNNIYRIIRSKKNRFGSTQGVAIFEMMSNGLRNVKNPSEILISNKIEKLSGTSIAIAIEGIQPILLEVQALVSPAIYGTSQRSSTGFEIKRLNMLLAVLEKRFGFKLSLKDVFLNITGGIKIDDPSIDLSVVISLISSSLNISISDKFCFTGEIGLSGEIRPSPRINQRILEAEKLGYEKIFISKYNKPSCNHKIVVSKVGTIDQIYANLFKLN